MTKEKLIKAFERLEEEKRKEILDKDINCICGKCTIPIVFRRSEILKLFDEVMENGG